MKVFFAAGAALSLALAAVPAHAGPYGDDLSKCLVSSTTEADKTLMVKWIFSALSLNREVSTFVDMPAAVRQQLDKDTASLYMRLLTDTCRTQTHNAFKYEGKAAIEGAFQLLGQVASQGIFSDPAVAAGMIGLMQHFDQAKLGAVLEGK